MKKTVLVNVGVLIEVEESELQKDFGEADITVNKINEAIDRELAYEESSQLGCQSSSFIELDSDNVNCGRCAECACWVTDCEKPGRVKNLNIGAVWEGRLLCDEHLPKGHRWAF